MLNTFKLFKLDCWPDPAPRIPYTVRHLELLACPGLRTLDDFGHLTRLQILRLGVCVDLTDVTLRQFSRLEELSLVDIAVATLDDLNRVSRLRTAYLSDLSNLVEIVADGRRQRALRRLSVCRCPVLRNIDGLHSLEGLERVTLTELPSLASVRALIGLRELRTLSITGCPRLTRIAPLVRLPALEKVKLIRCPAIADLALWGARPDVEVEVD